jgi:hypothetical protein
MVAVYNEVICVNLNLVSRISHTVSGSVICDYAQSSHLPTIPHVIWTGVDESSVYKYNMQIW